MANLIQRMKAEIAIEKERLRQEEKAGQKAAGARTPKAAFLSVADCVVKGLTTYSVPAKIAKK